MAWPTLAHVYEIVFDITTCLWLGGGMGSFSDIINARLSEQYGAGGMNDPHRFTVTDADDRGVPTAAVCACGQWTWLRPDGDDWADTLPTLARAHEHR